MGRKEGWLPKQSSHSYKHGKKKKRGKKKWDGNPSGNKSGSGETTVERFTFATEFKKNYLCGVNEWLEWSKRMTWVE